MRLLRVCQLARRKREVVVGQLFDLTFGCGIESGHASGTLSTELLTRGEECFQTRRGILMIGESFVSETCAGSWLEEAECEQRPIGIQIPQTTDQIQACPPVGPGLTRDPEDEVVHRLDATCECVLDDSDGVIFVVLLTNLGQNALRSAFGPDLELSASTFGKQVPVGRIQASEVDRTGKAKPVAAWQALSPKSGELPQSAKARGDIQLRKVELTHAETILDAHQDLYRVLDREHAECKAAPIAEVTVLATTLACHKHEGVLFVAEHPALLQVGLKVDLVIGRTPVEER